MSHYVTCSTDNTPSSCIYTTSSANWLTSSSISIVSSSCLSTNATTQDLSASIVSLIIICVILFVALVSCCVVNGLLLLYIKRIKDKKYDVIVRRFSGRQRFVSNDGTIKLKSCESYGYNIERESHENNNNDDDNDDGVYAEPAIYEECRSDVDYKIYY
ncbi:PREDICTED: uncharacterized protein LOC109581213 [Amphimedon queenslandica]|uniref:Uncharacterized protein n=1 Tax=Amphimedon queenslandica TaxID=400682 RepID=A0A1X7V493_AMPQE|nr:PREDICTED: uncharacterized protein LOC109581213 [Amphimedon queenslandica]|eukprot:XP_019850673.1 PREDICTED: uncharacterized protein LOC109581213 [Amphimedon queenslandica]